MRFTWNGKRCYETIDLAPTPSNIKAVTRLMGKVHREIEAGIFDYAENFPSSKSLATAEALPFSTYATTWLASLAISKATREVYASRLRGWNELIGDKALTEIVHTDLATAAVALGGGELSGRSINGYLTILRGVFETAMADRLITVDPTALLKNRRTPKPEPDPFDVAEMKLILDRMAQQYDERILNWFETAFMTGVRTSEQLALTWPKIDWVKRTARIDCALVRGETKGTKTWQVRDVDLNDRAIAALTRQKAHTFMRDPTGRIFDNPKTLAPWLDHSGPREDYFTPTLRALGLRKRAAYQTRHTFATTLLMGGVNIAYISRQLGHSSVATTLSYYAKWIDGADKGREAKLANSLFGQELAKPGSKVLK